MREEFINFTTITNFNELDYLSSEKDYDDRFSQVLNFIDIIHSNDVRKNNEAYTSHHIYPVAALIKKLGLGSTFIKVALLHDAIEDHPNEVVEYFQKSEIHLLDQQGIELNLLAYRWDISDKVSDRSVVENLFIMANEFAESPQEATMMYEMLKKLTKPKHKRFSNKYERDMAYVDQLTTGEFIKPTLIVKLCDMYQNCISSKHNPFDESNDYFVKTEKIVDRIDKIYLNLIGEENKYDSIIIFMICKLRELLRGVSFVKAA